MGKTYFEDINYAWQQGGAFAKEVAVHQHKLLDEQAQIKARTQMLEYKVAENDFLKNIETTGDYNDWQRQADEFLAAQKDYINENAGNELTAKYMNQNLDASRANLQMQIKNKYFERMRKDELNEYGRQIELVEQNTSGQERIDGVANLTKEMYDKGHIDEAGRDRLLSQTYSSSTLDEYTAQCNAIASTAVANGWTEDKTEAEMKKALSELPAYSMKGTNGKDISQLFTPEMKSKALSSAVKAGTDIYKNDLEVLQTKNKEYCAELLRRERSLAPDDYKGRNFLRQQGREYLREQEKLNPNSFSAAGKQEYASAFQPLKQPEKNSSEGNANAVKKFDSEIVSLSNMWVQHKFTGDYQGINTGEEAINYLDIKARSYAKANGLDEDAFAIDMRFKLIDELEKKVKLVPEAASAVSDIKDALKSVSKSTYEAEIAWEIAGPMLMSEIFSLDIGSKEGKEALKNKTYDLRRQIVTDKINRAAEGTMLSEKIKGNTKYFSDYGYSQTPQQERNMVVDFFDDLNSDNTYAYIYTRTGEHIIKPGSEEMIDLLKTKTKDIAGSILGVDASKISTSWHKDSSHHITDQIDFTLPDGKVVHTVVDRRNKSLSFVDDNGKEVISSEQVQSYFDAKEKEAQWNRGSEQRAKEERDKALKLKEKQLKEINEKRYRQHVDASVIQIYIEEHKSDIRKLMKQGLSEEEAIQKSIEEYNKHTSDPIQYAPDWKKHNRF